MSSTKVLSPSDSSMPINGSGPVLRKWLWKTSYPFAVLYQTTWVGLKEEEKKNSWHTKIQSPAYLQLAEFFLSEMSGLDNNQSSGEEHLSLYGKFLFRDKICVLKIIYADINNKEKKSRKCALKGKCKWFVIPWYAMMFCKKLRIFSSHVHLGGKTLSVVRPIAYVIAIFFSDIHSWPIHYWRGLDLLRKCA